MGNPFSSPKADPTLTLVLLGGSDGGKSSSGNTILGSDKFKVRGDVKNCIKEKLKTDERKIYVVDTPRWKRGSFKTLNYVEKECSGGCCAFLLVIPVDSTIDRPLIYNQMMQFEENLRRNTMLLFTHGDRLKNRSIEDYVHGDNEDVQWLVSLCDDRYHVFNNIEKRERAQVTELLEKIEKMVSEGGNSFLSQKMTEIPQTYKTTSLLPKRHAEKPTYREYHSMDCIPSSVRQEAEEGQQSEHPLHIREANSCDIIPPLMSDEALPGERGETETHSANKGEGPMEEGEKARPEPLGKDTEMDEFQLYRAGSDPHLPPNMAELRLVLLGCSEDGKRAAGKTILGREAFVSKDNLICERHRGEVVGRKISIVNTPDQLVSSAGQSEVSVEREVRRCLLLSSPGPHTFLLVLPIRGFTDEERGVLQAMEELFGRTVFSHTIILFTHTATMTQETLQLYLQEKRLDLQQLLEKCGNRHYLLSSKERRDKTKLMEMIEEMMKEQECMFVDQDIEERLAEREKQREKRMEKCREEEEHRKKQKETSEKMELMRKDLEEKLKNSMELFTELQLEMKQKPTDERARNQEMELLLKDHQEKFRTLQECVQELDKRFLQDKDSLKKQLEEKLREQEERQKKSIDELKVEQEQKESEAKKCNEKNSKKRQGELTKISDEYKEKTKDLEQAHQRQKEELEEKHKERERELQQKYEEESRKARDEQRSEEERKLAELQESYEEQRRVADEKMKKMTDEIETNMAELSHQYEEREKELKQQMEEERDALERWLEEKHKEELQQLRQQLEQHRREREEEEKRKMEQWIKEREKQEKHNKEMKVKEEEWREREDEMKQQIMEQKEELSRREEELSIKTEKQVPQRSWWGLFNSIIPFGVSEEDPHTASPTAPPTGTEVQQQLEKKDSLLKMEEQLQEKDRTTEQLQEEKRKLQEENKELKEENRKLKTEREDAATKILEMEQVFQDYDQEAEGDRETIEALQKLAAQITAASLETEQGEEATQAF